MWGRNQPTFSLHCPSLERTRAQQGPETSCLQHLRWRKLRRFVEQKDCILSSRAGGIGLILPWKEGQDMTGNAAMAELQRGAASAQEKNFDAAIAHWERALAIIDQQRSMGVTVEPRLIAMLCSNIASVCIQKRDLQGATSWLRRALSESPRDVAAALNLGSILAQAGKLREAIDLFRVAAEADGGCLEAHALLGACLAESGELQGAQASYARAVELKPDWAEAHGKLADLSRRLGDFARAQAHYDKALALRPDWKEMAYQRATLVTSAVAFNSRESMDSFFGDPGVVEMYLSPERRKFFTLVIGLLSSRGIEANGKRIADVGCGTGHLLEEVKRVFLSASLTGFEYSTSALKIAQNLLPEARFHEFDIYEGLKGREQFDVVMCTEVLEHLLYPARALENLLAMVASSSGTLLLTVPNGRTDTYEGHINFWSPESWKVFVESSAAQLGCRVETGLVHNCNFAIVRR